MTFKEKVAKLLEEGLSEKPSVFDRFDQLQIISKLL
jgi:hypothetical protein